MRNELETILDTAGSYIGREDIPCQFHTCLPTEDEQRNAYFIKLC
jgi:hypothetical protein